jgi:hypothetical protein
MRSIAGDNPDTVEKNSRVSDLLKITEDSIKSSGKFSARVLVRTIDAPAS